MQSLRDGSPRKSRPAVVREHRVMNILKHGAWRTDIQVGHVGEDIDESHHDVHRQDEEYMVRMDGDGDNRGGEKLNPWIISGQ
jgi:hypothetical protein